MGLTFEWDGKRAKESAKAHGVGFEEAASVFGDPLSLTIAAGEEALPVEAHVIVGQSYYKRLLVVAHTVQQDIINIIAARVATADEKAVYEVSKRRL